MRAGALLGDERAAPVGGVALLGDEGARLLAGPSADAGAESFAAQRARLGPLVLGTPEDTRSLIGASGLLGRGGAEFPTALKLAAAAASGALVVVNASEGEPASRKDELLCRFRPHLVLDGACVAARAVSGARAVVYVHRRRGGAALGAALAERTEDGGVALGLHEPAERYIAGESSAVADALAGGAGLPRRRSFASARARATVVINAETAAHLALLARGGAAWFRAAGSDAAPGSTLVTLAGGFARAGSVVELLAPVALGRLAAATGSLGAPEAVLVGGYAGTWVPGAAAAGLSIGRGGAVPLGCGVLAPLEGASCGVAETARLVRYLARESSGQCGPCLHGLAELAARFDALALGTARRRDVERTRALAASLRGRGGCGHPTGVAQLAESALEVFADEVHRHSAGAACAAKAVGLPLPREEQPCPWR